jgi:hypothetical protein
MPRLTPDEHEAYMHSIMSMYENPDDGAEMISRLRDDYTASLEAIEGVPQAEYDELSGKYNTLREQYINRFFGGNADLMEAKDKQSEDIKDDEEGKQLTYEEVAESYTGKDE